MKRMNEVFELPLTWQDENCGTVGSVYEADKQIILQAQESVKTVGLDRRIVVSARNEKAQHAAHAINNVDSLADALELMINATEGYSSWHSSEQKQAIAALNAYRGAK